MELNFWLASIFVFAARGETEPGIYGVGCSKIGDALYVMGGSQTAGEKDPNPKVYRMDLSQLNPPRWETTRFLMPNDAMYVGVAPMANRSRVLVLGGKNVNLDGGFYSFGADGPSDAFIALSSPRGVTSSITQEILQKYPYGGGFVQATDNDYLFYGGYELNSKGGNATNFMYRYDLSSNTWYDDNPRGGPSTFFNSGQMYNGSLYVVGGSDKDENIMPLSQVWKYDNSRMIWSKLNTTGADPGNRAHHSAIVVDNKMYVVGGQDIQRINNRIDILNLDTLTWSTKQIPGLVGKLQGCLAYHKGYLVYGFGFSDPFVSKPASIDLKSFQLSQQSDPLPTPTIIGITIGCIAAALLALVIVLVYGRSRRIRKSNAEQVATYNEQVRQYNALADPIPPPELTSNPHDSIIPSLPSTLIDHHQPTFSTNITHPSQSLPK